MVSIRVNYDAPSLPNTDIIPAEVRIFIDKVLENTFDEQTLFENFRDYIRRYPRIPVLQSTYSIQLYKFGYTEEALAIGEQCFRTFRHYPFGRLRYAHLLCSEERYDEMGEVMRGFREQLPRLYPKRKEFYYAEVAIFMYLGACYFYSIAQPSHGDTHASIFTHIMDTAEDNSLMRYVMQAAIATVKAKFTDGAESTTAASTKEL